MPGIDYPPGFKYLKVKHINGVLNVANPKTATYVEIFGEKVYFFLSEHALQVDHVLTKEETKRREKGSLWYSQRYDYHPDGNLTLNIDAPAAS